MPVPDGDVSNTGLPYHRWPVNIHPLYQVGPRKTHLIFVFPETVDCGVPKFFLYRYQVPPWRSPSFFTDNRS